MRIEAALTLRALAEVDPTCVGGLISYGVTTLHALREILSPEKVEELELYISCHHFSVLWFEKLFLDFVKMFINQGSHLNPDLDSLHGQATILAALVSISPRLLLGYPARSLSFFIYVLPIKTYFEL